LEYRYRWSIKYWQVAKHRWKNWKYRYRF